MPKLSVTYSKRNSDRLLLQTTICIIVYYNLKWTLFSPPGTHGSMIDSILPTVWKSLLQWRPLGTILDYNDMYCDVQDKSSEQW